MIRITVMGAAALFLSSCGVPEFTPPQSNPSIKQNLANSYDKLSTTAARRLVIAPTEGKNKGRFCTEASPDVETSVDSGFDTSIVGNLKGASATTEGLSDVFSDAVTSSDAALTQRSQGLQFYRDGLFSLCQARLNGFFGEGPAADQEYIKQYWALRNQAMELAKVEIQGTHWAAPPSLTVTAPAAVAPATVTSTVTSP